MEMMESHARNKKPEATTQAKHPPPPTSHDPRKEAIDKKRKREQKRKEVVKEGRDVSSKKIEPQRGAKVVKTT